jgi:hypothetical protein
MRMTLLLVHCDLPPLEEYLERISADTDDPDEIRHLAQLTMRYVWAREELLRYVTTLGGKVSNN